MVPELLPPAAHAGKTRILFLSIWALGWKTYAQQLEQFAAGRDDVDAVHLRLIPPLWMRALNRPLPGLGRPLAPPPTTWRWQVGRWLGAALPLERFDVVFASPLPAGEALVNSARRNGIKLSGSLDCTDVLYRRDLLGQGEGAPEVIRRESVGYRAFDLLAPWSHWAADSLRNDYGVESERIQVCRPSVGGPAALAAAGATLSPPPARALVNLLFVGNDFQRKGGSLLLRWHQRHFADRAQLHIVSGKATPQPDAKNVVWHGLVPNEKLLSDILPAMDLFVFPTQRDMFGIVIVEAAAFGLPVIASRMAAIPELVKEGETGMLCDPKDERAFVEAIARLIDDQPLRQRMSAAARRRAAEEFTPAAQYGPLFDRFGELAARRLGK